MSKINQYFTQFWCGTSESFAEYLNEQPLARLGLYLPEAGSLTQLEEQMDEKYKEKITREEYLQAFALFVVANSHYRQYGTFSAAMNRIVCPGLVGWGSGHLDDAVVDDSPVTMELFNQCLERQGIEVEDEKA